MRKTLLASLVLAALAAPAFAENSVTIYGQANAALEYANNGSKDTGTAGKVTNFKVDAGSGLETPSRLGFKGVETLTDGLNAWFQVETTLNLQDKNNDGTSGSNPTQFGDREAWVGLQGADWGKIGLGHGKTAYVNLADKVDSLVIAANNLAIYQVNKVVVNNTNDTDGVITKRPANSVRYDSPVWGGFSFATSYGFGENKTATTPASGSFSLGANWTDGMWFVGAAYQSDNNIAENATTAGGVTTYTPAANISASTGISGNKQNATLLLGSVKVSDFTFGLGGQISTTDWVAATNLPVTETKRSAFTTWGTYAMDQWLFKAGVIAFSNAKVNGATVSSSGDVRYMVGANYNFSKQTFGFVEFAGDQNKGQVVSKDATMPKGTLVNSATPTWLSIGLSHAF